MPKTPEIADQIQEIENYVVRTMGKVENPDLRIAHDFKHVDRVRRWALHIARDEGYADLALVEAAALLHDIGLAHVTERSDHGGVGAEGNFSFWGSGSHVCQACKISPKDGLSLNRTETVTK